MAKQGLENLQKKQNITKTTTVSNEPKTSNTTNSWGEVRQQTTGVQSTFDPTRITPVSGTRTSAKTIKPQEAVTPKTPTVPGMANSAVSSLVGSSATQEDKVKGYTDQNKHIGNILGNVRASSNKESADTAYMLANLLEGGKAFREQQNEQRMNYYNSRGLEVKQVTPWETGDEITNSLINSLYDRSNRKRDRANELAEDAYTNWGQYETDAGRTIDEVFSNAGSNALRWGKRAALAALGVPGLDMLSDASMFLSSAGDVLRDARANGADDGNAMAYALATGLANAGFEHLSEASNPFRQNATNLDTFISDRIKSSNLKPVVQYVANLIAGAGEEGLEEYFTELATQVARRATIGDDQTYAEGAADRVRAFLMGGASALLLSGFVPDNSYSKYREDLAMYYWQMPDAEKGEVIDTLARVFDKDPALLARSIEDHALDAVRDMDGETLMRAIDESPVYIDPNTGSSIYEITQYSDDQKVAQDYAKRAGVDQKTVEELDSVTGKNGKRYIKNGFVTDDGQIIISSESKTPIMDTVGHEIVHAGSGTEEGKAFLQFAVDMEKDARGEEGFNEYFKDLSEEYSSVYDPSSPKFNGKVLEEVGADFSKKLWDDPEIAQRLLRRNGNVFNRVYQSLQDAVSSFKGTDNLTAEQKQLLKAEKLYSDMVDRMRRDAIMDGMGLADGESVTKQMLDKLKGVIVQRGKRGEPMTTTAQVAFSMSEDTPMMDKAKKVNEESKKKNNGVPFVSDEVMERAEQQRLAVKALMSRPKVLAVLPADDTTTNGKANTKLKNGSYGISEENTTVCVRMMSNEYVLDRVAESIGRPLNVSESLKISQMFMQWAAKAQCLYCYEGMDRWAKREFHNRWFDARDYVVGRLTNGDSFNDVYADYLEKFLGRKPDQKNGATDKRMQMWQKIANGEMESMPRSALASVDARDKAWSEHPEWREQLKNADGYAQSASYAKKKIAYTAYDGHILSWSDKFVNQLNSDFGMRMYSFSDFSKAFILENMQMVTDASVKGLKGLAYTKEEDFVKIFAPTGMLINCSIFGMNTKNGVERDEMQGMKWEDAQALRAKYPNVGVIFVATNNEQVEWGLDQDWIDVVIPFHTVKTGDQIAATLNYTNYRGMQEDRKLPGWDKNKHVKSISPAMHNNDLETYLRLCEENYLEPRFKEWLDNPNYMKLVNETRLPYNEAQPMQPNFDISEVESMLDDFVRRGGFENEGYGSVKIPLTQVADRIANAFIRDGGAKYSATERFSLSDEELDQQYFDAIDRNDMNEAQRLRLEHAAENGYTDRAYHGTQAFGFTEPDVSYSDDGKSFFVTDDRDVAKTYAGTDVVKPISGNNGTWLDNEIHNTEKQIDASVNDFIDALNQVAGNTNWHPDVSQLNSDLWTIASNYVDNTAVNANSSLSKDIDDELFHWIGKAWQEGNPGENNMMPWLMSSESDYVSEVEDKVIDRFGRFINLINGTDTNRGIYDLVINPDNLLEHDAKGKKWNDLDIIIEQGGRTKETTRSLADYAQGEGYNGYVLNNVFDDGGFGATRQQNPATVYDLFDPGSQVKSADTITYDDNGNIIPLSQRDNPNKKDIRYSLSKNASQDVDNVLNDTNYEGEVLLRDTTPPIMLSQKGVRDLPMLMNASHIRENILTEDEARTKGLPVNSRTHYHGLGKDFFLKVLDGLDNVSRAYRGTSNAEKSERRENYFLLISQIKDDSGNLVNVPVYIDEKGQYNRVFIDTNKLASVFGRNNLDRYIQNQIKKGNLVRVKNRNVQNSEQPAPIADRFDLNVSKNNNNTSSEVVNGSMYSLEDFDASEPHLVLDEETVNWLNHQPTQTVYRAMQVIDGELYPPMAAKVKDADGKAQLVQPSRLGEWERSTERPDLIKSGNKFTLNKGNGSSLDARYNPYFHTSLSPLNDQFSSAYNRPNLVVVEGEVPASELQGIYKAQYAKDPVGMMKWHSGPVSSKLKGDKARKVILSRWFKPNRIVSDAEVARRVADTLEGENIEVPYNTVTPGLRSELEKLGVPIKTEGVRFSLSEQADQDAIDNYIPEQANAFPDRNVPRDRSAMRTLGNISRERGQSIDPLTYEEVSPENLPEPEDYFDVKTLLENEDSKRYGFEEDDLKAPTEADIDLYRSLSGNKTGALQGFATIGQTLDRVAQGEAREELRQKFEVPMYDTKKAYNQAREKQWSELESMIEKTGIKANTPESAAVQWYGEGVKANEQGETVPYTLNDLKREFPSNWEKIVEMERYMRKTYDEYVDRINTALEQVYPNLEEKAQVQLNKWRIQMQTLQSQRELTRNNPAVEDYLEREIAKYEGKIQKLQGDLESGEYFRNKRLRPRKDYFHHFQEVETQGIGGLKNILQATTLIDPELVGKSANTKPRARWMAWLQPRGQGAYTADAVLGMGKYIDGAEYAIAFDPLIAQYRDEVSKMVQATKKTKNANQLIQYLSAYTNQLAGKTPSLDRTILDLLGEGNRGQLFNALSAINNRAKSNAVVGNIRSAVAQFFNIPNAMSIIKSDKAWGKGVADYISAKLGNRDLLEQSPFLQERYWDHSVDDLKARNTVWEKLKGKASDVTNAMMEFGDREATELIWLAAYNEGKDKGVADPVYYADDLTRRSVAGRGIGEVPYNMKSKVASFFMPFQVESNNQWQNLKGMIKDKDAKGIFRLMLGTYLMNAMVKPLFNDGVLPDILGALVDGIKKLFDKDREETVGEIALDTGKRMAGEAVSMIPGTSLWLPAIMSSDSAEALFGDSDPTRYGTGTVGLSNITKTLADAVDGDDYFDLMTPLLQLGLPYGGKQASRLYNTLQDFNVLPSNGWANTPINGEMNPVNGDYSRAGALRYTLPSEVNSWDDAAEIARAFMFGSNATNAAQEYYDTGKPALSAEKVAKLREDPNLDPELYIQYLKEANADGNGGISQQEAAEWISSHNLTKDEADALWNATNSNWKKSYEDYSSKDTGNKSGNTGNTSNNSVPKNKTELAKLADSNGNGTLTQAEAWEWLSKQDIPEAQKASIWRNCGWKTSYYDYKEKHS